MDRPSLETWLRQGLSLREIGARVGRDPTTVGYWVKKYGLTAVNRERAAPRGAPNREELAALVDAGLSHESIAAALDRSTSTVRHWLRRYGLATRRTARLRAGREARAAGLATARMVCRRHGETEFWLEGRGAYRCLRCRWEAVSRRRRKVKAILVEDAGGACRLCGYRTFVGALQFHHPDPKTKAFAVSRDGITHSLSRTQEEARKCVLLCANCHAEVEAGIATLA